ncbi:LacI family DNA-binding transcriptional regulator [Acidipropionibacterium virtanenii]|nr:LacI family DNA-binding transcriptional regulator [Acidipropionibacterium virtanenii]
MTARLKDVASRAGVSVKTVSNVVNNKPYVKPETRQRVEAAVKELGYRPNIAARQLKRGRSGFIGLVVPEFETPYFAELASRIWAEAERHGYTTLLNLTGADPKLERSAFQGVGNQLIDGLIFSPQALSGPQIIERTEALPMVMLGEQPVPTGLDHVAIDSVRAARKATDHLLARGHRRIGAIGLSTGRGTSLQRAEGYRQALRAAGIPIDQELAVGVPSYSRRAGHAAMNRLLCLPEPPTAVFCFNDAMAVGAIRACYEAGISVPREMAVAGIDDIPEGRYITPSLTTVSPDLEFLARETIRLLLRRIEAVASDDTPPGVDISVPWRLTIRESTGGAGS